MSDAAEHNKLEVTPEMVAAGIGALCECDFQADRYAAIVKTVFLAMLSGRHEFLSHPLIPERS